MTKKSKTKILFLYPNDPSPGIIEIAQLLENTGNFESHIAYWHRENSNISIPFSTNLSLDRIHPISLSDPRGNPLRRARLSIKFALRLRQLIKRLRPPTIYAVNPDMLGLANLALFNIRGTGIVYDFQDQKGTSLNAVTRYTYRKILRKAKFVLIRSEGFRDQIESQKLIGNSTPVEYLAEAPANWTQIRNRPTSSEGLTVGYFGNIRGKTQLSNLVNAVATLRTSGCDIELNVAGGGPDSAWFHSMVEDLPYVNFSGPFDYFKQYRSKFESADVIHAVYPLDWVNYYTHEARRFHEAVTAGIPIVVSDGTYMARRVNTLGVGWSVGAESKEDLVAVLRNAYEMRHELSTMTAEDEVRKQHQLESYESLLVRAINTTAIHG